MKNNFLGWLRKSYIFLIILVTYVPLLIVVLLSFTAGSDKGNLNLNFEFNGFENWIQLFQNNDFLNAITNTAIIVSITVPLSTIIAVVTCFGIWRSKQVYTNTVMSISKVNMVIPDVITGISLALLFSITIIPLGVNLGFATIILAHVSFCTPYAIIAIYPRMQKMNKNLILASMDLGYSQFTTFFKVTIPFLMPAIISGALLVFAMSFDDFIITKLIGGKVNTISTEIYSMAKGIKMWAVTFGALITIIGIAITVLIAIRKYWKDKSNKRKSNIKIYTKKQKARVKV